MDYAAIDRAKEHFGKLLEVQMKRMERVKATPDWIDYSKLKPIKIGILAGDGIGRLHRRRGQARPRSSCSRTRSRPARSSSTTSRA